MMCALSLSLFSMERPENAVVILNERISHFQPTSDGGYLTLGSKIHIPNVSSTGIYSKKYMTNSYYLGKVDASGDQEWHKRYSINSENTPTVTETDSGYTIHSYTDSNGYYLKNELQLSFDGDSIQFSVDSMPYTNDSSWIDTTTVNTYQCNSTWEIESVVDGYTTETLSACDTVHLQNGNVLVLWSCGGRPIFCYYSHGKRYVKYKYYSILGIVPSSQIAVANSKLLQSDIKSDYFNIQNNQLSLSNDTPYRIKIFSANGRLLRNFSGVNTTVSLNKQGLASGMYQMQIVQGANLFTSQFILK